ncbi:MAG: hypothetical protein BAJALOKI1v1_170013 [Promethearchaeota archaeon]|nr:MAG: hypothetical protein BAJALOKI1v1_170013 [Candidatus Lokiarchaeota archaeon]
MESANIQIIIQFYGIGNLKAKLVRHHAPLSADAIIDKLPLVLRGRFGPTFKSKQYWTLPGVEIYKGLNTNAHKKVKKGAIVYNPKTDELMIILEDQELPTKVNLIGEVEINLELVLKARNGLNTKIAPI